MYCFLIYLFSNQQIIHLIILKQRTPILNNEDQSSNQQLKQLLAEEDEVFFDSCCSYTTYKFVVPPKRYIYIKLNRNLFLEVWTNIHSLHLLHLQILGQQHISLHPYCPTMWYGCLLHIAKCVQWLVWVKHRCNCCFVHLHLVGNLHCSISARCWWCTTRGRYLSFCWQLGNCRCFQNVPCFYFVCIPHHLHVSIV